MPTAVGEKTCVCGLNMRTFVGPGVGYFCPNCDSVQEQEANGVPRIPTKQDIRFNMFWFRVIKSEYKDNRKPKPKGKGKGDVGTTHNDTDGEK